MQTLNSFQRESIRKLEGEGYTVARLGNWIEVDGKPVMSVEKVDSLCDPYASEFRIERSQKSGKFWISWAPFSYVYGTMTGSYNTHNAAREAALDSLYDMPMDYNAA